MALIAERKNRTMASEGTILNSAINTAVAAFGKDGGRKARSAFQKLIKGLLKDTTGDDPEPPSRPSRRRGK